MTDSNETGLGARSAGAAGRRPEYDGDAESARAALALLRNLFAKVRDGIAVLDRDRVVRRANAVLESWFADLGPLSGRPFSDLIGADGASLVEDAMRVDGLVTREIRLDRGAGRRIWLEIHAFPLASGDAEPEGAIAYFRDVTQRKITEESLRKSEERFAKVFQMSPNAVTLSRLSDGVYLEVNEGFERLTGYRAVEAIGVPSVELGIWVNPETRGVWAEKLLANGEVTDFEVDLSRKDGVVRTCLVSARLIDVAQTHCVLAVTRDVTEQRQAQSKLEESEKNYRTIIENSLEGICITQDLRIRYCNRSYLEMFGLESTEQAIGRPIDDFVDPGSLEVVRGRVRAREAGESEADHYYFGARRADGTRFEVESLATRVTYEGRPASLAIMRDATERRRLEEKLRQAQKMEAIGTLAGGIAHDFNNLLTSIIGNLDLASRYAPAESRSFLANAQQASQRAADLVQQILTFSRKTPAEKGPVRPSMVVDECVTMLRETLDRRIGVEVDMDDSTWSVHGDLGQVRQVLMNLAINARDAIGAAFGEAEAEGSVDARRDWIIRFALEDITADEEFLRSRVHGKRGQFVRFRVRDTGAGMSEEVLARIFEPFFTTKDPGVGTGLGLATVFGIVEQHDGWIDVRSQPGAGTTFDVYFPRYVGEERQIEEAAEETAPAGGTETILLVDDERMICDLGRAILERLGYTVLLAENGQAALDRFIQDRARIDLVILDLVMPYLSGWEVLEQMRALKPGQKILLSSGYDLRVEGRGRASLSPMEYVSKPYRVDVLARKVRALLDAPEV